MRNKMGLLMSIILVWVVGQAAAQNTVPLLAFVNTSDQLVATRADGSMRWIITNPGQNLAPTLGYSWSPDGSQIFYALDEAEALSLWVGDIATQRQTALGSAVENASGGSWQDDTVILNNAPQPVLISPYRLPDAHLAQPTSISPDGEHQLVLLSGEYVLDDLALGLRGDAAVRNSGLWSETRVAVWGIDTITGRAALVVVDAENQQQAKLESSGSAPVQVVLWLDPDTLLYRDSGGQVFAVDVSCLATSCDDNPFAESVFVLDAAATQMQAVDDYLFYISGTAIGALPLECIASQTCASDERMLAENVAPRTILHVVGDVLSYTAYANNPTSASDRILNRIDLTCLNSADDDCDAVAFINAAIGGMLSPDGRYIVVEILNDGLYSVRLSDGHRTYLTGNGVNMQLIRWAN